VGQCRIVRGEEWGKQPAEQDECHRRRRNRLATKDGDGRTGDAEQ
jgi:hypothetical protein